MHVLVHSPCSLSSFVLFLYAGTYSHCPRSACNSCPIKERKAGVLFVQATIVGYIIKTHSRTYLKHVQTGIKGW